MYAGIILAAGASTRFRSPKALVQVGKEPAVARLSRQLKAAGCDEIRVVVGTHARQIAPAVPGFAKVVAHPGWAGGRTGSLKAALRTLGPHCCLVVWPVDHPAVDTLTLSMIMDGPGDIRIPTYQGKRGHPVLFEAALRTELLALGDDQPLHDVVHRDATRVTEVPVDDSGVLLNIDTPDDLKKLRSYLERSVHARTPS